jgi:transposase
MLIDPQTLDILLCTQATDMRKSIDGLCQIVCQDLKLNPSDCRLYVFCNRSRDKVKILYWDGNGFCLLYKRLEKGRFRLPRFEETASLSLSQLRWLLQGFNPDLHPQQKQISFEAYG